MSLPGPLDAIDLGEEALGFLRTAAQYPFVGPDGSEKRPSIWFVVCASRCWLVAATESSHWAIADVAPGLEKGWTWDAIRLGSYTLPLRQGSRSKASSLLRTWKKSPQGGEPVVPTPTSRPAQRAPAARGAYNVPEWLAAETPAPPEARWLFAFETGLERPRFHEDGTITTHAVWLGITDRSLHLATPTWSRDLDGPASRSTRLAGRPELSIDGWTLPGALVDRMTAPAEAMANANDRWSEAARQAADRGDIDTVIQLLDEAFVLDRHHHCFDVLGGLDPDPARATGSVAQIEDVSTVVERWDRWAKHRTDRLPAGMLRECVPPVIPAGMPWPPQSTLETVAFGAMLSGRVKQGLALLPPTPRTLEALAAVEDSAESWVEAARALRPTQPLSAREALERAIALSDEAPELCWLAGAWSLADGLDPQPWWNRALTVEPSSDLPLDAEGWRQLAQSAASNPSWVVTALAQVEVLDSLDRSGLVERARLLETQLDEPGSALAVLRTLATRTEGVAEPEPARWWVWCEIARLSQTLAPDEAALALEEALRGDFLVPAAWSRALELGESICPERIPWWAHVRGVLDDTTAGEPRPAETLDALALDALHPGGVGWLERARQSVDSNAPPPLADLTRGLEKVEPTRQAALAQTVADIAEHLGIEPPDTYLFRGEGAWGLSAWPTAPPIVLLGHDHLEDGDVGMTDAALRFALAVECVHLAADHPLLAFDAGLVGTSRSVYETFGRYAGTAETVVDVVTLLPGIDQLAKIQTVIRLSRRVFTTRSLIDKTTGAAQTGLSWWSWIKEPTPEEKTVGRPFEGVALQFRMAADRGALRVTGDLRAAILAILKSHPSSACHAERFDSEGLLAVLTEVDGDTAVRIANLVEFAATL